MSAPPVARFDVAVVGAGPAGATAAYVLAKKGFKVVVLERGRTPGTKNLYGGRVYAAPLEEIYDGFKDEAPVERWVKRERISLVSGDGMLTLEYSSDSSTSFTAYLSKLASWMAQKASDAGAIIVTDVRVDELWVEDGAVKGVRAGEDRLEADVVIDAEGINRLLLERAGLAPKLSPRQVALGLKEVIRLDVRRINERFGLESKEGLAWYLIGGSTDYLPGGAFLYTNSTTVSLGIVVFLEEAREKAERHVFDILEGLRLRPPMRELLGDGTLVEYGAHLTPELGLELMPSKPYRDGFLVAGDAAGFLLNLGYTVRGVDFAAYSGYLAAKAVEKAHGEGGYGEENLAHYQKLLEESFILKELRKHRRIGRLMGKEHLFTLYPPMLVEAARKLFEFKGSSPTIMEAIREAARGRRSLLRIILDMWDMVRGP